MPLTLRARPIDSGKASSGPDVTPPRPRVAIDLDGVTPEALRGQSLDEVCRRRVFHGREEIDLAEAFDVSGSAKDGRIVVEGDLQGVDRLAAGMTWGEMRIVGSAGQRVGEGMTGGEVLVEGDVGDGAGGEMCGGLLRIRGGAGDRLGAALPGEARGMTGGEIIVEGRCGAEVGRAMRRGLICASEVGPQAGCAMIAGTIVVLQRYGDGIGSGMNRGTVILAGGCDEAIPVGFVRGCRGRVSFVPLLAARLKALGHATDDRLGRPRWQFWHGDSTALGRGEIFTPA